VGDFTIAEMDKHIGQELGVSDWVTIDQSRIDTFASCTGDHQWIHVDVDRAQRERPYGGPVAHGYLTLSMVAPLSMQIGILPKDSSAGLNYVRLRLGHSYEYRATGFTAAMRVISDARLRSI